MDIKVEYLVKKTPKHGRPSWYIQPSKTLRDAGWTGYPLGKIDEGEAIKAAKAFAARVELWRAGGQKPNEVKARVQKDTLASLIERYRKEVLNGNRPDGRPWLQPSTRKTYATALTRLNMWAGKHPLGYVTPARVRALRDASLQTIGHDPTHKLLKMGRTLFEFAVSVDLVERNPFVKFKLGAPPPREHIISAPAHDALVEAALEAKRPSLALAIMLGLAIGQRQNDYLTLIHSKYVPIPRHKMLPHVWDIHCQLAPNGAPMGVRVKQAKTRKWVEVPVVGTVREALEANIARARVHGIATILFDDRGGMREGRETPPAPYAGLAGQNKFQDQFAECRVTAAANVRALGDAELADEIANCKFLDFRRSCISHLGELGLEDHEIAAISGHDIETTRRILATYMPRSTGRASAAVATVALRAQADKDQRLKKEERG